MGTIAPPRRCRRPRKQSTARTAEAQSCSATSDWIQRGAGATVVAATGVAWTSSSLSISRPSSSVCVDHGDVQGLSAWAPTTARGRSLVEADPAGLLAWPLPAREPASPLLAGRAEPPPRSPVGFSSARSSAARLAATPDSAASESWIAPPSSSCRPSQPLCSCLQHHSCLFADQALLQCCCPTEQSHLAQRCGAAGFSEATEGDSFGGVAGAFLLPSLCVCLAECSGSSFCAFLATGRGAISGPFSQYHSVEASPCVGLPLSLITWVMVPFPLRHTDRGFSNEFSNQSGQAMPRGTVTSKSRKKWYTPTP
mmetsp:Transcript_22074/g.57620  ORF Transcript_22074/g.57620 Transcript_22074/m.57620 type:complete len:311 (+) Transcript_22074:858-1790(+)